MKITDMKYGQTYLYSRYSMEQTSPRSAEVAIPLDLDHTYTESKSRSWSAPRGPVQVARRTGRVLVLVLSTRVYAELTEQGRSLIMSLRVEDTEQYSELNQARLKELAELGVSSCCVTTVPAKHLLGDFEEVMAELVRRGVAADQAADLRAALKDERKERYQALNRLLEPLTGREDYFPSYESGTTVSVPLELLEQLVLAARTETVR